MSSVLDVLVSSHLRSVMIFLLVGLNVALAVLGWRLRVTQRENAFAVRALVADRELTQRRLLYQQENVERHLVLLAEIAGHIEVALGRTRLSRSSVDLLATANGQSQPPL